MQPPPGLVSTKKEESPAQKLDRACLAFGRGDVEKSLEICREELNSDPDNHLYLLACGHLYSKLENWEKALESYRMAHELQPADAFIYSCFRTVLQKKVPTWHFPMLADQVRNDAYQEAIERAIKPGLTVLDIGTGTGLLAMMAARAGARQITACEMDPEISKSAQTIITENGYSNSIQVLSKRSTDLKIPQDIGEPVDLIVSEIVDLGLLGEHILPTMRHALKHLAKPHAQLIPASATVVAQLIEFPRLSAINPFGEISGFKFHPLNRFRNPSSYKGISLKREPHTILSTEFHALEIDFYNPPPFASAESPHKKELSICTTDDGILHAVVFWFELHLDEQTIRSSGPEGTMPCWGQAVQFLEYPYPVKKNQVVTLKVLHHDTELSWQFPKRAKES